MNWLLIRPIGDPILANRYHPALLYDEAHGIMIAYLANWYMRLLYPVKWGACRYLTNIGYGASVICTKLINGGILLMSLFDTLSEGSQRRRPVWGG